MENLIVDEAFLNCRKTVVDSVYDLIKKNILNWNLKPGQRISEKNVSAYLNVSKTPVRESFIRLGKEKLIDILPQRGTYVSKIDLKDVEEGLFIRKSLELSVINLAIDFLTDDTFNEMRELLDLQRKSITNRNYIDFLEHDDNFHSQIFKGAHKERTLIIMNEANAQYKRVRMLTLIDIDKYESLILEHSELLTALENKNIYEARRIMEEHLSKISFEENILKSKYPNYFL